MDILRQSYTYGKSPLTAKSRSIPYHAFLFGASISQSLSPLLHGILFKSANAVWSYDKVQTTDRSTFEGILAANDTIGSSITMPNKVTFGSSLDHLTEEARVIGAVNTSFVRTAADGRRVHIGTNTDCVGIREAILQRYPAAPSTSKGKPAMVVGGGGAARSAIYALWKWFGPSEIYISNRLDSEVEDIMQYFRRAIPSIQLRHLESVESAEHVSAPHIIIGTVPDYPPTQPGEILCAEICDAVLRKPEKGLLMDMCYMPSPQTKLLRRAEDQGWNTVLGTDVLVRVCVAQQILWVEEVPNEAGVKEALEAMSEKTKAQPITLKLSGKVIKNRMYRTPLSEYASTYDEDNVENSGKPLPRYAELYQELADGGAGLICTGNIPIHRDNLENYNNAVLDINNPWDPVEAFAPAVKAAKSRGALFLPQLQFPGRQVPEFLNANPKSSSDQQLHPCLNKTYGKPSQLTKGEILDLVRRYVWASEVLDKAGADGIILHASHGYIMQQFLSPLINKRTDEYGGSLENRARFILDIVNAIKARLPSTRFVIAAKLNCHDFIEGGTSFAEMCVVIKWLEDAGVDFFDISGGTYASPAWRGNIMTELAERPSQKERGSYFIEWAQELKKVLTRAVIGTTGGWRDSHRMSAAVEHGDVDMIGLGRPLRENPNFVNQVLRGEIRRSNL
ncbi:hypothetical protein BDV18DRAFT_155247 [Aspergillus unguis]